MMDTKSLAKTTNFDDLPESWVIFITEKDVIGKNRPLYLFERVLIGDWEQFGDDTHILYVNGACRDDTPLGKLMHDFACTNADKMYYNILAERTRYFKETKEGEPVMNKLLEKYTAQVESKAKQEGKSEGVAIGKSEGIESVVVAMLKAGKYAIEEIASLSGLSVDEVKALQAELTAKA